MFILLTVQVNAITRYIDFSVGVGSDANDGITAGEAWLTESYADTQLSTNDVLRYIQAQDDDANGVLADWEALADDGVITWTKEIKQWEITWTIDGYERFGRYATGDFWVYHATSIDLTAIDPVSTSAGNDENGSMINPSATGTAQANKQGYYSTASYSTYDASLNVALDNGGAFTVNTESSLVSTVADNGTLPDASILTVVDTVPSVGDFRPPYCGSDKTSNYNISSIDATAYGYFEDINPATLTKFPDGGSSGNNNYADGQTWAEAKVQRVWLDHLYGDKSRDVHPDNHMNGYGREICADIGDVALFLHLAPPISDAVNKLPTLTGLLQIGIDNYGVLQDAISEGVSTTWYADGGHSSGRKLPIIIAGAIFNEAGMKACGFIDGLTRQTFIVDADDIFAFPYAKTDVSGTDLWASYTTTGPTEWLEYTNYHLGMPEWGIKHGEFAHPTRLDTPLWDETTYRGDSTGDGWIGEVLAIRMFDFGGGNDGKTLWDWDALFDYMDRFRGIRSNYRSIFADEMWDDNRGSYGALWADAATYSAFETAAATPTNIALVSKTFNSITVSWSGSTAGYDISTNQTTAYLGVTSPYTITGLNPSVSYEIEVWGRKANGIRSLVPDELTVTTEASLASLIAHYKMDDLAGQTVVADATGNNHTGSAANNITSTNGRIGNAITFDSDANDYVQIADAAAFDGTAQITVACWAKSGVADITLQPTMVSKYSTGNDKREWQFLLNAAEKVQIFISEDGTFDAGKAWNWTTDDAITVTQWHHYAFTFNAGTFVVYVDGISVDVTDSTSNSGTSFNNDDAPVLIGGRFSNSGTPAYEDFFDGDIDDVRIYNEALTASQIRSLIDTDRYGNTNRNYRRSRY